MVFSLYGAWLWEEYVNTLLEDFDFIHAENRLHKKGIWLFEDIDEEGKMDRSGWRYPDFIRITSCWMPNISGWKTTRK